MKKKKILIYSSGGLGDILVRIPHFKAIRNYYSNDFISLLTNTPYTENSIKDYISIFPNNLIDEVICYDPGKNKFINFFKLLRRVYLNKPEIIINLVIRKSYFQILRDRVFFSIFIPNKKIGFKYLKIIKTVENNNLMYENISVKVARLLDDKFKIDLEKAENWTINNEFESTQSLGFGYNQKYIVISVGGKYDTQQWGDENWKLLLNKLAENYNTLNFVFIGSKDEGLRVNNIIPIKFLSRFHNLCGVTTPKNGANIIRNSILFLGQDSGPMHLSASVNHDSILIHSARTLPGEWFPLNGNNYIFYNRVSCYGCYSKICTKYNKKCIAEISVEDVFQKIKNKISK